MTGDRGGGRFERPVVVFPDTIALTGCAVIDGDLYFGSFDGHVWRLPDGRRGRGAVEQVATVPGGVTDVLRGPDGLLYIATNDAIWTMEPVAAAAPSSASPSTEPNRPSPSPAVEPGEPDDGSSVRRGSPSARWSRWGSGWACGSPPVDGSDVRADPVGSAVDPDRRRPERASLFRRLVAAGAAAVRVLEARVVLPHGLGPGVPDLVDAEPDAGADESTSDDPEHDRDRLTSDGLLVGGSAPRRPLAAAATSPTRRTP